MSNDGVAAVEKALSLLDCFQPGKESLSLAALSKASGIHVTTVYRLMNSLERMRYVVRAGTGDYSLGHRVQFLGNLYEHSATQFSGIVQPALRELAAATSASASYTVIEDSEALVLFRAEPAEGLRITRLPGDKHPFDNSATSDVLRFWGLGEPVFDKPPKLPVFKSRARDAHTAAMSVPIFGAEDKFVASLTLSGAATTLEEADAAGEMAARQLDVASRLSRQLGASQALCEREYVA
jgi:DNA-binding IclR family transcriptional regulator